MLYYKRLPWFDTFILWRRTFSDWVRRLPIIKRCGSHSSNIYPENKQSRVMSGIDVRYTLIQTMSFCWNIHSLTEDIFRINSAVCQLSKDVEVRIKATSLKINMQSRVMPDINVIFTLIQMITFTDMIQLIAVLWRRTFSGLSTQSGNHQKLWKSKFKQLTWKSSYNQVLCWLLM